MSRRKGITIGKIRSGVYLAGKLLGDVQAVKRGRVEERLWNRLVGYLINRLWKKS